MLFYRSVCNSRSPLVFTLLFQVDYVGLATKGVPVLKPIYLNDFLVSEQPPSLELFMLEEFKEHWEKKKRARVITDTPTNAQKKSKSVLDAI